MHTNQARMVVLLAFALVAGLGVALVDPVPVSAMDVEGKTLFGLGVIAGEPTGGTLKLWFGPRLALQSHLAITWWNVNRFVGYIDFLWHPSVVTENKHFLLLWYFGVGGGTGIRAPWDERRHPNDPDKDGDWEADPAAWIRVPFGFPFIFDRVPVEAFVEFGPALRVYPAVGIGPFVAIGGRWYF